MRFVDLFDTRQKFFYLSLRKQNASADAIKTHSSCFSRSQQRDPENQFDNTVSVIEAATNTVVATVPVGQGPTGVAITPNGGLCLRDEFVW